MKWVPRSLAHSTWPFPHGRFHSPPLLHPPPQSSINVPTTFFLSNAIPISTRTPKVALLHAWSPSKPAAPPCISLLRHARARRTFDLACAVPDSGGVAAGGGDSSRACRGSSSRLHARPQLQASTPTLQASTPKLECDGERGTGGDSRGGGVDSGQPGQILRPSGAASLTSISPVAVLGGEEEDEDWAWA